ncbi:MAG TPA: CinA family nicotinamide mononucleotide deamidase-related protein [Thermomicrobiaceae bacterium]|nr:CinA family nicotinamide mononucleotide deamidase-related protein [Thermomicrobiaceae bacterium]
MRAVILSIGSELIEGFVTDTNATFLAQEMATLGIELVGVMQVGDNLPRIVKTLRRAWDDADLIVTTGGIGPTDDDLTREAIAELLSESVAIDPELLAVVEAFFGARGVQMPEQNAKQAWLIPSASALLNPMGTAPGWFVHRRDHFVVSMPGVPREMMRMWREQAVPRLQPFIGSRVVVSLTLKTIGVGESAAERQIADIIARGYPVVATYAKDDGVHVRVTAASDDALEAEATVRRGAEEIRQILRRFIYGDDAISLGAAIFAPLVANGRTIAVSEAGSGGRTAGLLAEEPAAVVHYHGGIVRAFEHVAAENGIDSAAPDAHIAVAAREADAVRAQLHADYGLAVVVRLTPGPSLDQTRGDVALCLSNGTRRAERQQQVTTTASEIRRRAAMSAAEFAWSRLLTDLIPPQ